MAIPVPIRLLNRRNLLTFCVPPALLFVFPNRYITHVRARPDYGDKRKRNKRTGPGGGTRRLHHSDWRDRCGGGETGSTDV